MLPGTARRAYLGSRSSSGAQKTPWPVQSIRQRIPTVGVAASLLPWEKATPLSAAAPWLARAAARAPISLRRAGEFTRRFSSPAPSCALVPRL
jgi:hypothetical protein